MSAVHSDHPSDTIKMIRETPLPASSMTSPTGI